MAEDRLVESCPLRVLRELGSFQNMAGARAAELMVEYASQILLLRERCRCTSADHEALHDPATAFAERKRPRRGKRELKRDD